MGATHHAPGIFAITRAKIFVVLSLALTWWFAYLLPNYKPMIEAQIKSRLDEARQKIPAIKVDWRRPNNPRDAYNQTKVALIIEPRPIPHLVPQILHMITVVPPDWRFVFIGSDKSTLSVGRSVAVKHHQVVGKLDLMVLPEPWEIDSKEKVHRLLTDLRFYDEFLPGVEWILKYESDSILCANSEESLNDWLDWSWAGAPRSPEDRFSGNGGLSLRKVAAIRRILAFQARYNDTEPEDEWFGKRLWVLPGEKVAQGTEGVLAVEDVYVEKPMGYHIRDGGSNLNDAVWKDHNQRKKILEYCPELSLIMNMKLERERCEGDDREGVIHPTEEEKEAERLKHEEEERQRLEEERRQKEEEDRKKAAEASAHAQSASAHRPAATGVATGAATRAATGAATGAATRVATGAATRTATGIVIGGPTGTPTQAITEPDETLELGEPEETLEVAPPPPPSETEGEEASASAEPTSLGEETLQPFDTDV